MTTSTRLPIEAYLQMSFEPDCEYVDGRLVERSVGDLKHSKAQAEFMGTICDNARSLCVRPALRMRSAHRRYRVADVAVFTEEPTEEYPETPPLIVLEIVSRDDRHTEIVEKLAEYLRWGVRHVWLADPYNLMLHVYGEDGLRQVSSLDLAEYDLRIRREDLF